MCWERIRSRLSILSIWVLVCTFTSTIKPLWSSFNWCVCVRFTWESLTSLKPRSLRGYQAVCRLHQKFWRRRKTMFGKRKQKKAQGGAVFLSVGCFITVSASHRHLSDIQKRLIMLSSVLPLSCISAFDSAQDAEITWTVSYLHKCFCYAAGF